jgi:WD40 repeat protein/tetratricopeptide (TPR) repeat protein
LQDSRGELAPTLDFQPNAGEPASSVSAETSSTAATLPHAPENKTPGGAPILSQQIPGYEILGELGRGGMGIVYKARQIKLNRIVALKMILAGASADPQQLARFRAEAEAVARVQHPCIVQIYEISEHDGCPFFSLEYVDGGTLAEKISAAPQPPRLAAQFVRLLAQAMHSAHLKGIVHRDLKPGNILLAPLTEHTSGPDSFHAEMQAAFHLYGIPKITDFGLAKHLDIQSQTRTGAIIGTPSYMAPEQAEGRTHTVGPATDVYGLGAILYEMLTGRPPFTSDSSLTTIRQLLTQDPLRPSQLSLKVPRDLETICLKCLEKDPGKRYHSAEELAEDLDRFLRNKPIEARPTGWWGRSIKWMRRHPTRAALLAAALALFGLGLVYHFRLEYAVEAARRSAEDSRQNLIRLHVTQGVTAMNAGDGFTALLWFTEALRLDPGTAEHEDPHRQRIAAVEHGLPRPAQLWVHEGAINETCFSPDGRRVLTAGAYGKVHLWDRETGEETTPTLIHNGSVLHAVFSADGRRVATASRDHTARVWDAATGKALTPPLKHDAPVSWIAFSPDGRQVATAGAGDKARVWEAVGDGRLLGELKHSGAVNQAVFSPDGRWLATAGDDGLARLWDAATRKPVAIVFSHDRAVLCLAFSPDSKHLATGSSDHTVRIWDVATGAPVGRHLRHRGRVTHVTFSPFGHRLLTAGEDGTANIWRVADGERLIEPIHHTSAILSIVFSPDGCRVATGGDDNIARVWSANTGKALTPPLRYNGTVNHVAFSPDGRWLATVSDDGTARLWGVACRQPAVVVDEAAVFRHRADRLLRVGAADAGNSPPKRPTATSPDGRFVLKIDDDSTARVYDAGTGQPVTPPLAHRREIIYAAFSPDGRRVVTTSADQTARVWDAASGAPVSPPLTHASLVEFAAFSPDGRRLATASDDNTARVWNVESGELLLPPLKHNGTVMQAVFTADGRRLATGSLDQTARVWDAATGQPLTPPLQHPWPVLRVQFSPDNHHLLASGSSGTVWSWELPCSACVTGDLIRLAQLLSGSRLDEHRGVMPLRPSEQKELWTSLRETQSDLFHFTEDDVMAWHRQTAEECYRGGHWSPALWHLDRLIEREPDNWLDYARRGLVRAELERWKEASADFAEVVRRAPNEREAWCLYALVRLHAGDAAEYRRACAALLELQEKSDDPRAAYLAAWVCVLSPDADVKGTRLVELAKRVVDWQPEDPDYLCILGAALFRAGDLEDAARRLNEALALRGRRAGACEWLWLALVRYHMGLPMEARQWLDKAAPVLDGADAPPWVQRLQMGLLRREVEQLLKSDKSSSK